MSTTPFRDRHTHSEYRTAGYRFVGASPDGRVRRPTSARLHRRGPHDHRRPLSRDTRTQTARPVLACQPLVQGRLPDAIYCIAGEERTIDVTIDDRYGPAAPVCLTRSIQRSPARHTVTAPSVTAHRPPMTTATCPPYRRPDRYRRPVRDVLDMFQGASDARASTGDHSEPCGAVSTIWSLSNRRRLEDGRGGAARERPSRSDTTHPRRASRRQLATNGYDARRGDGHDVTLVRSGNE